MTELAGEGLAMLAPPGGEVPRIRRWLDGALPILAVFLFLIAIWYILAAFFNLQSLNLQMPTINPAGWHRMSLAQKLHEALTTNNPTMPTPVQTLRDFLSRIFASPNDPNSLWIDLFWTARAAVLGFLVGAVIGVGLALLFMSSRLLTRSLMPYVVASQTIPIVALVPAILVSLGLGLRSEVLISAYLAFFSITISTYKGLQSVQPLAFELMRSYAASRGQVFFKLRLPAALPFLFTGLKIGVAASLVGSIIAELPSGSSHGLGQALVAASTYSANIQLWSTMTASAFLGLVLYGAIVLAERVLVRWSPEAAE
jgi:NitT/TauT family transport system permease protein